MEYQVPAKHHLDFYEECVDKIFTNASTRGIDYNATKEVARLQGINMVSVRDSENKTLLHIAAGYGRKSWVTGLLSDKANVNAQDNEGRTPLHAACNHAHKTVAEKLIEAGADVNLADKTGWTALHFALTRKHKNEIKIQDKYWDVVELLLAFGADPYLESRSNNNSKKTCLDRIRDEEQKREVRLAHLTFLLSDLHPDDPIGRAKTIDKFLYVEDFFELVKIGDDNIERIQQLITPNVLKMRLAERENITPLHRAAGHNHLDVAKLFIDSGANVNATDDLGRIPLHNAAQYGHIEMIELLIEAGSEVDKRALTGHTPLHEAATNITFSASLRLIELGANKNIRSNAGELPYDLAHSDDVKEVLALDQVRMVPSKSEQAVYIVFQGAQHSAQHSSIEPNCRLQTHLISEPDNLMLDSSSSARLISNPEHKLKKVILDKSDSRYQLVARRMLESIVCHASDLGGRFSSYDILSIELMLMETAWAKYRLACQRLEIEHGPGSKNEKLLFHGSSRVDEIQIKGFNVCYAQRDGMFGAGLYFGEHSSKSNQYVFGFGKGCAKHDDKSCYECERKMIYAQVALGKSHIGKEAFPNSPHGPPGYDSVVALPEVTDGLAYPEYVVYKDDQAYPLFVITYRIKK
uniref:Poly [ADP-ribose] polymerase n=1 Tax=Aceria tosichella TaxID=561515 RepID=A0A6G1SKH3_9ACAR